MSEQRFIDLETKISHQEYLIDELNQVIYEQQKTIDKIEAQIAIFAKKLEEALNDGPEIRGPDEKPPHY